MATVTENTAAGASEFPLAVPEWREAAEGGSRSEQYLAKRLRAAAADHRSVAWSTFFAGSGVGLLVWLFIGVLAEHWIVAGGLPLWARAGWLLVALVGLGLAGFRWLLPLLRYRINLVYAARTIEQGHPDLHNDLVNTVLLREHADGIPETVVHSLRRRTARGLSRQPGDLVADRSQLLAMVYVLAALVGLACLYQLFSPKNLLVSAVRLAAPWSRIMPPTRVGIEPAEFAWRMPPLEGRLADGLRHPLSVEESQVTLHRGRQLIVSTTIRGRRRGEQPQVRVVPLTDSGRPDVAAAWTVPMVRRTGGAAGAAEDASDEPASDAPASRREVYEVVLPGADRGMDRSAECTILAGDAQTEPVRVLMVDIPSLLVREVRYDFPSYTRRPPETVQWQGDLRAIEGTRATLMAEASLPLSRAWIDFGCDGRTDWEFTIPSHDLVTGRATFPLKLNESRTGPWTDSYVLLFQLASAASEEMFSGEVRHRIEVIADLPPEVRIVKPVEQSLRVPPDDPVPVQIAARDPDFAIRKVGLEYRVLVDDQTVADGIVWRPEMDHSGPLSATLLLIPGDVGAAVGTRIAYRAVVEDNREPQPNRGSSHRDDEPWPVLLIDAKAPPQEVPPQPPAASEEAQPRQEQPEPSRGESADSQQQDRSDPPQDGQQGEGQSGGQDGQQAGEGDGNQEADQQSGGSDEATANQQDSGADSQQSSGGQAGESGQGRDGEAGEGSQPAPSEGQRGSQDGQQEGDGGESGLQPDAGEGRESEGAGQQGQGGQQGRDGESVRSEPIASDGTEDGEAMERILQHRREAAEQGEGQQGEGQQGEGQQGEGQQGEGQQGEGQQGEGQQGEGQQGEGQQGEGQQGEGQQGGGQQGESQQGPSADLAESGETRGMAGQGSWSDGQGERDAGDREATPSELEWGDANLEHARNATDLAIEHLRESLSRGDRDLLDQLGWSEEQARAFLARWDAMQRLQQSENPEDRVEFERSVRSLGLRPEGMQTRRRATRQRRDGEAEGTRSRPPSEYLERVRAYTEGLSTQ